MIVFFEVEGCAECPFCQGPDHSEYCGHKDGPVNRLKDFTRSVDKLCPYRNYTVKVDEN